MWICPKCGREFKRTNQGHYCGKAPATSTEYIESQSPEVRLHLNGIRNAILDSVPDVNERIAWSMPTYEKAGNSISFSACKNHVSFYTGIETIEKFKSELNGFTTNKNAIYFPYNKKLPLGLIRDIARWGLCTNDI